MLQPNGFLIAWQDAEGQTCYTLYFGQDLPPGLARFYLHCAVPRDGIPSALHGQRVAFSPEMLNDPEQLRDGLGVGVRAGVPYFGGRENP